MNTKKLLLLVLTMLLISTRENLAASRFFADSQGYSDTESTDSLLRDTSRELMQAYDLLEMLKKRSEDFSFESNEVDSAVTTHLPRNIDHIRNRLIKKQLLDVLSATPFSNPDKHMADCKTAITALEAYTEELKRNTTTTKHTPLQTQKIDETTIAQQYDISDETPHITPQQPKSFSAAQQPAAPATTTPTPPHVQPVTPPMPAPIPLQITKELKPIAPTIPAMPAPLPVKTVAPTTQQSATPQAPTTQPMTPQAPLPQPLPVQASPALTTPTPVTAPTPQPTPPLPAPLPVAKVASTTMPQTLPVPSASTPQTPQSKPMTTPNTTTPTNLPAPLTPPVAVTTTPKTPATK